MEEIIIFIIIITFQVLAINQAPCQRDCVHISLNYHHNLVRLVLAPFTDEKTEN